MLLVALRDQSLSGGLPSERISGLLHGRTAYPLTGRRRTPSDIARPLVYLDERRTIGPAVYWRVVRASERVQRYANN